MEGEFQELQKWLHAVEKDAASHPELIDGPDIEAHAVTEEVQETIDRSGETAPESFGAKMEGAHLEAQLRALIDVFVTLNDRDMLTPEVREVFLDKAQRILDTEVSIHENPTIGTLRGLLEGMRKY